MYFPVVPLTELRADFFKEVLYDYLFCRIRSFSRKKYVDKDKTPEVINRMRIHFEKHRDSIIGLGERDGKFWIPREMS